MFLISAVLHAVLMTRWLDFLLSKAELYAVKLSSKLSCFFLMNFLFVYSLFHQNLKVAIKKKQPSKPSAPDKELALIQGLI